MDTLCYTMRGLGMSMLPTVISLTGACLFRIVWIYTVFEAYHTQFSLYISYPISWSLTAGAYVICYLIVRKKKFIEPEPVRQAA
jgi:Na+-driven multidrug efflux pump